MPFDRLDGILLRDFVGSLTTDILTPQKVGGQRWNCSVYPTDSVDTGYSWRNKRLATVSGGWSNQSTNPQVTRLPASSKLTCYQIFPQSREDRRNRLRDDVEALYCPTSSHGHRWLCRYNNSTCTCARWRYSVLKHRPLVVRKNETELHLSEWPFIVASLRHTCAIFMRATQHLDMPHLLGGMIISAKEKCSLPHIKTDLLTISERNWFFVFIEKVLDLWVQLMKNGSKNKKCCVYIFVSVNFPVSHLFSFCKLWLRWPLWGWETLQPQWWRVMRTPQLNKTRGGEQHQVL